MLSSCKQESFFEFERPPQSPYNSLTEFERSAIGAYGHYFNSSNLHVSTIFKNTVADELANASPGDYNWGFYRDTESTDSRDLRWACYPYPYRVIAVCNDALELVANSDGDPFPGISADDRTYNLNRIIGELHFMRAYSYYLLSTLFGEAYVPGGANDDKRLPLRTTFSTTADEAISPEMGTTEQIWSLILDDFLKAYELLPEKYIAGKMHESYSVGRANKFAAAAMLSRSYFFMGNYTKANEYADFVISQNGGEYDLSEDPIEAFNKISATRGKEAILTIPYYDTRIGSPSKYAAIFSYHPTADWTSFYMDHDVVERLGWMLDPKNDTTFTMVAKRDKRFQQLMFVFEPYGVPESEQLPDRIYETNSTLTFRTILAGKFYRGAGNDQGLGNYAVIRLAEMYLTRSICRFKANDKEGAANDLNVVRKRAWDEEVAGESYEASASFVTSDNITEQMINDERLIEMYCEGDRIDYLRGLKVDVANGAQRGGGTTPYTDKGFVWDLPESETNYNRSLN
jgi:hypothetical protein